MEKKKYTQFGTLSVIFFLPIFVLMLSLFVKSGFKDANTLFVSLILFLCLLLFYKLTIVIDDKFVTFRLGIGLFWKKYKLTDITDCEMAEWKFLDGVGIRWTSSGWIYSVTGFKGIELNFNNRSSVRIGTNKSEEISEIINKITKDNRG